MTNMNGDSNNRDIPKRSDLFSIKEDLENAVHEPQSRIKRLQNDLLNLEKVKIKEPSVDKPRPVTGGKNIEVVMERFKKQQQQQQQSASASPNSRSGSSAKQGDLMQRRLFDNDTMEDNDDEYDSFTETKDEIPNVRHRVTKNQLERQAALETLKRRRRREDDHGNGTQYAANRTSSQSPSPPTSSSNPSESFTTTSSSADPTFNSLMRKRKVLKEEEEEDEEKSQQSRKRHEAVAPPRSPQQPKERQIASARHDEPDIVRVKPQHQVPIYTFWNAMEPYFRPLTEEDRNFLLQKGDDVSPFQIPPLGQHYREQWAAEDRGIQEELSSSTSSRKLRDDLSKKESAEKSNLLLQRLLNTLVPENLDEKEKAELLAEATEEDDDVDCRCEQEDTQTDDSIITHVEVASNAESSSDDEDGEGEVDFGERLKQELQYVGILVDDDEAEWDAKEDDQISAELRRLGRDLKEQMEINNFRKRRLLDVVDRQLQYEQYRQILDHFDAQVEQAYAKRVRVQKAKKRKAGSTHKTPLPEAIVAAMEKRTMWVEKVGCLMRDKNLVSPSKSIYET